MHEANQSDAPFDRVLRRLRRDRAATDKGDARFLLHRAADELLDRLDLVARRFGRALDLGCGDAYLTDRLRGRGIEVDPVDAGPHFAARADGVCADEDRQSWGEAAYDLVVSIGVLDTVNDLPGALTLVRRALRPDGLFLAAFSGAGSLPRLRASLRAAEEAEGRPASPRMHPQIDVRAAGDLLTRAGFALPVADCDGVDVRYSSFARLVADLRGMACSNMLAARDKRPIGRVGFAAATAAFEAQADVDGKIVERFQILHLSGWAPDPGQPQPARRGSATESLATALKRKT